jgi:putative membrane protein
VTLADVSPASPPPSRLPVVLLVTTTAALVVSGIHPFDGPTWWLEVFPVLAAIPTLVLTRKRFPLTSLTYVLLAIHALILMVGGHYTYALVPAGDWVKDALHLARNPYDRLGHLAQGFVPAILAREVLLRTSPLRRGGWLFVIVTAMCLSISALYELVEWLTAIVMGSGATDFLGTQGDPWDTQWDMFCAWIGAMAAQVVLSRVHDRQLVRIDPREAP